MRVSELGICAAPLAFVQFASGLQMTLSQCCLFSVIMYYEVVIAVVVVFFRGGGELDTISLSFGHLEIVRGIESNFLPPETTHKLHPA